MTDARWKEHVARRESLLQGRSHPVVLCCGTPGCVIELEHHLNHGEMTWLDDMIGGSGWTVMSVPAKPGSQDTKAMVKCPSCSRGKGPITNSPFCGVSASRD